MLILIGNFVFESKSHGPQLQKHLSDVFALAAVMLFIGGTHSKKPGSCLIKHAFGSAVSLNHKFNRRAKHHLNSFN